MTGVQIETGGGILYRLGQGVLYTCISIPTNIPLWSIFKESLMPIKKTGTYKGKSNKLGYGWRAQQLKDAGVPGGVIGKLARMAQAAPGQKNYHGKRGK